MSSTLRRTIATLALLGLGPASARAQTRADTARYVVLFSGRPAGGYREVTGAGERRATFEYNDRGRGPHVAFTTRLDARGIPTSFTAVGHAYLKDSVDETFTATADSARWHNTTERGALARPGRAVYVSASGDPGELRGLVRAALAAGGRVALLPNGSATVERVGARAVRVGGKEVRVAQYDVNGLGFDPVPVWLEEGGERFATVSEWFSLVPEGWEPAIPELVRAQTAASDARALRLARELSHRPAGPLVIRGASLFVAESASVRPHTTVVVTGNRITAVGPDGSVAVPAGAQVIDAAGQTLLPGLWDMHVHGADGTSGMLDLAAGVTTARDMGDDTVQTLVARRRLNADSIVGPRYILAGLIDGSGPFQVPTGVLADDSAAARRAVDWYAAHGYEQIKVYSSMKPELVPVIVAAAKAHGLRVSGHVPAYMTAAQVVSLGFDEVQHANMLLLNFMDSVRDTRSMARFTAIAEHGAELDLAAARVREFVALVKSRGVDLDPTLVAFEGMYTARPGELDPSQRAIADRMPPQVRRGFFAGGLPVPPGRDARYRAGFDAMKRIVKVMYDAGVPIVAGTDSYPSGFVLHRELELYVEAGVPAPAVLQLATLGAARVMRHDDDRGSVAVGKLADLVLVRGDPTRDIADVRRTALVVKNGIVFRPAEIYAALGIRP